MMLIMNFNERKSVCACEDVVYTQGINAGVKYGRDGVCVCVCVSVCECVWCVCVCVCVCVYGTAYFSFLVSSITSFSGNNAFLKFSLITEDTA
jgi:hypothetical protein